MSRAPLLGLAALGLLLAGCNRGPDEPEAGKTVTVDVPVSPPDSAGTTPMADRVAVIALLNKRNGIVQDFTLKPGQAVRAKDVVIRLRACDSSAPWETERLTGAFVQLDVLRPDKHWGRVFSGWLYKESPSLNVVEHPVYDVWVRSCAMNWPSAPGAPPSARDSSSVSSAVKSAGGSSPSAAPPSNSAAPAAAPPPEPAPSAPVNNAT